MTTTPPEPIPLPEAGPATVGGVKFRASITDTDDDADLEVLVAAVNALVRRWPGPRSLVYLDEADPPVSQWPADVVLGANMLGARLWRRRNTVGGVEVYGDNGIAYVRRNDPDIAMLLQLDDWSKGQVG